MVRNLKAAEAAGRLTNKLGTYKHAAGLNRLLGTRRLVGRGYATLHPDPADHLGTAHASLDDLIDALTKTAALPTGTLV
jgi:CRISPR system Cascade subunit CasC